MDIHKHMNCIQMNMEYICNILKKDFSKMFVYSWDFYYKPNSNYFSPKNLSSRQFRKLKLEAQLRYLGLEAQDIDLRNLFKIKTIDQYIDNHKALLLNIDSFDCPWHRGYMKTHIDHYCLVIGHLHKGYICADPYLMGNSPVLLTHSQLRMGKELIYYKHSSDTADLSVDALFLEIIYGENNKSKMFNMMELFLKSLSEISDSSQLFDYLEDVYLCAITRATKFIADGRIQLGYLIEKLSSSHQKHEDIFLLYNLLYHSGDLWNHLNLIFIKIYCAPRQFESAKRKIIDYMLEIIDVEKNIYCGIKNFLANA